MTDDSEYRGIVAGGDVGGGDVGIDEDSDEQIQELEFSDYINGNHQDQLNKFNIMLETSYINFYGENIEMPIKKVMELHI